MTTSILSAPRRVRWKPVAAIAILALGLSYVADQLPSDGEFGALSLLPSLLILFTAVVTRRPLEAILTGVIAGLLLLDPSELVTGLADLSVNVMMNETIAWIILVCGMMGGLINLLERGGSVLSFSELLTRRLKSPRQALLCTAGLGVLVFIDDYLNSLAVSATMKNLTDRYRISREKLAYVVDSTAAPVCILVPVSTWAVYFAALLEENQAVPAGEGMSLYIEAIPYMAYGWAALLVVGLVVTGWLGDIGPMKSAEARARAGKPVPDDAAGLNLDTASLPRTKPVTGLLNFLLPMAVLVGASLYYDIDLLKGALVASVFTLVLYFVQGLMKCEQLVEAMLDGFKVMLYPIAVVAAGFMVKEVNDQLGMTPYIIDAVSPLLSPVVLPALVFALMAAVVFATGSSWGVFVVSLPIVIPMAQAMDVSMPLTVGALLSASAFGSHACFFSDSTVLSSQGAGCSTMGHAITQLPYALIGGGITLLGFLLLGYLIA